MGLVKSFSEREVKKMMSICHKVLSYEEEYKKYTDFGLELMTNKFKDRIASGESLDSILPEAFAVVREASWRVLRMRPYPVQIIGGIVLHRGFIAEMRTGEGKTLAATMPAYLNALTGKGVHVVTVNDYLAKRDCDMMGRVYRSLGLTVGYLSAAMEPDDRRRAYSCDILYSTSNEIGFDYMRDNMVHKYSDKVQREFNYAIVDEADSVLIDDARNPLIISGYSYNLSEHYLRANEFIKTLNGINIVEADDGSSKAVTEIVKGKIDPYAKYDEYDYIAEDKTHNAIFTEKGYKKIEEFYGIDVTDPQSADTLFFTSVALKAHSLYRKDVDYVVDESGSVIIIDTGTGRLMRGRRFSDGIHQAIEAKENVPIKEETSTFASITFQNLFKKYTKLCGMTGTAMTEKEEFMSVYGLSIVEVPTNKPVIRIDHPDLVYASMKAKERAIVELVSEAHRLGQPVLIGTSSVDSSDKYHLLLKKAGVPHNVLNARHHDKEADIIAQAGRLGAVTIATNMAGRGTDILLGGNAEYLAKKFMYDSGITREQLDDILIPDDVKDAQDPLRLDVRSKYHEKVADFNVETRAEHDKVVAAGGLLVVGTERHENRRIDNQLRGRAGRQGDIGVSIFFVSLEDDLMRLFGAYRVASIMQNTLPEDKPIDARILSGAIEAAQTNVEAAHFRHRSTTIQYDAINAVVRDGVYSQRDEVLKASDYSDIYRSMVDTYVKNFCSINELSPAVASERINGIFYDQIDFGEKAYAYTDEEAEQMLKDGLYQMIQKGVTLVDEKHQEASIEMQRDLLLKYIDTHWFNFMENMAIIKNGVSMNMLSQKDPFLAYKQQLYRAYLYMTIEMYEAIFKVYAVICKTTAGEASVPEEQKVPA